MGMRSIDSNLGIILLMFTVHSSDCFSYASYFLIFFILLLLTPKSSYSHIQLTLVLVPRAKLPHSTNGRTTVYIMQSGNW